MMGAPPQAPRDAARHAWLREPRGWTFRGPVNAEGEGPRRSMASAWLTSPLSKRQLGEESRRRFGENERDMAIRVHLRELKLDQASNVWPS